MRNVMWCDVTAHAYSKPNPEPNQVVLVPKSNQTVTI